MQLRAAATWLTDRAGKVGNIGKPKLAANADLLSALILEGVEELSLEDPDVEPAEPG